MSLPLAWVEVSWRQAGQQARAALTREPPALESPALSLCTCARVGWLLSGPRAEAEGRWLARRVQGAGEVGPVLRFGAEAVRRGLFVSAGLDSAAEGELDIGRQAIAALDRARAQHPEGPFATVEHVLYRLLRRGRRQGWIRARVGVPEAAAAFALKGGPASVGLVGAGAMGERASVALTRAGARFSWYNRTPRPGVHGLDALAPHPVWIVTTGAPGPWFEPPPGAAAVVDLGQPRQVLPGAGERTPLDALLEAAELRLTPGQRALAWEAVDESAQDLISRLRRVSPSTASELGVRP